MKDATDAMNQASFASDKLTASASRLTNAGFSKLQAAVNPAERALQQYNSTLAKVAQYRSPTADHHTSSLGVQHSCGRPVQSHLCLSAQTPALS